MLAVILGMTLSCSVCLFILLAARKVQHGLARSNYQSLLPYGDEAQALQDKHELNRLGFTQLLSRRLRGMSVVGLSFHSMAFISVVSLFYTPAIHIGGPSVIGIALPILAVFAILTAISIAEISSSVSTSGGLYQSAFMNGSSIWGIRVGVYQWCGQLSLLAIANGGAAFVADQLMSGRFQYTTTPISFGIWLAIVVLTQVLFTIGGKKLSTRLHSLAMWIQFSIIVFIFGSLVWLFWPGDYAANWLYQFNTFQLEGQVGPSSFILGALLLSRLFLGMDGAVQGSEETYEPRIRVPWAIFLSTSYVYLIGMLSLTVLTLLINPFHISTNIMASSVVDWGESSTNLFLERIASGWRGAPIVEVLILLSLWYGGTQTLTNCSRTLFSLGRDRCIPYHARLSQISVRHVVPKNAIVVSALFALLILILVMIVESGQFLIPLLSLAILCLNIGYVISIGLTLKPRGNNKPKDLREGPWQLGNWSNGIKIVTLVWLLAYSLFTMFYLPSTGLIGTSVVFLVTTILHMRYGREAFRLMSTTPKNDR